MSDNEYERFEITDYDLQNEFNINRQRRRQTKHQQIYGIWADDSDYESPEETMTRRGRRGRSPRHSNKPKDYSAPVSFVAGGIQQSGKKKAKAKAKEAAAVADKDASPEETSNPITDEEDGTETRPSFVQHPWASGKEAPADDSDSSTASEKAPSMAPKERSTFERKPSGGGGKLGAWEQHTRGIGAKLLLQMGYKPGKGLGKDLQGISQPVEAHVRKGRGAIGAYGPETAASVGGRAAKPAVEEEAREVRDIKGQPHKWRKSGDDGKSKRYFYKSVEEVIEKGKTTKVHYTEQLSSRLGNVPVIDMTGPERRVLSGYHAIGQARIFDEDLYEISTVPTKQAPLTEHFALPELMHNLNLIVDMCEQDIIVLDKTKKEAGEKYAGLEKEYRNYAEVTRLEENHIKTLEGALRLVDELTNTGDSGDELTLERAEQIFHELQRDFGTEYLEFSLGDLAAGAIAPLVKRSLEDWQPLEAPTDHINTIKVWRSILNRTKLQQESSNVFDPYSSLIWAGVIPSFRNCAADWNPKEHAPMAALLDSWAPLFPSWILNSVLEQLILQRLSYGVREWDPTKDTVPIHIWILPWNAILGHKMEEFVFPTIREKLGAALRAWMPQDRSARAMLTPWRDAFDAGAMQAFLLQHVVPKLTLALNQLIINPLQQDLELWNQVWEWHELLPPYQMAALLDKSFFPKWLQVLVLWLNQAPDYVEISRWYSGWKGMLSEEVLREPNIKEHLRRALEMMNRATEMTTPLVGPPTSIPVPPPPQPPPALFIDLQQQSAAPAHLEFKELVSQKCAERGILFAPMPGRRELNKQIYRVGKMFCYIDRNVCMISDSSFGNWCPVSLPQMIERSVTGLI